MNKKKITLEHFITENGIKMEAVQVLTTPNDPATKMAHFTCRFSRKGSKNRMTVKFSVGFSVIAKEIKKTGFHRTCRNILNETNRNVVYQIIEDPYRNWGERGNAVIEFNLECKIYKPSAADVLGILKNELDLANMSFEEFCDFCGYEYDSRKAEHNYNLCRQAVNDLKNFLGQDKFTKFMNDVEEM